MSFAERILATKYVANPFKGSTEKRVLYHATRTAFEKINRPPHGIYLTTVPSSVYGGIVIPVYANIRKYLTLDEQGWEDAVELISNRDYPEVAKMLKAWAKKGYDAYSYIPGPSMPKGKKENIIIQPYVELVNAETGAPL